MLLQFKFKNYKCFNDETILDLCATQEKRHIESTININGNNILPVIAIHGANASGKSSTLEALNYMFNFIKLSNRFDVNSDLPTNPFILSKKSAKGNSEYEVSICLDNYEYRYGFSLNRKRIEEEWLYMKKFRRGTKASQKVIFERYKDNVNFDKKYIKYEKTWNFFENDISLNISKLLVLSNLAIKEENGIFRNLYNYISKFNFKIESTLQNASVDILSENDSVYSKFQNIVHEFDPCLFGIKIETIDTNEGKKYNICGIHKNIDDDSIQTLIPLHRESNGTIRIFNIMPYILKNLEIGGLLCIDEIDVKLHPLLFKRIVQMYMDKSINKKNSQLIYTAHSTFLFNSNELRRDQLYLVDKDKLGKSKLYSLSEFKNLRVDADYEKKYLSGQFGAIPYEE